MVVAVPPPARLVSTWLGITTACVLLAMLAWMAVPVGPPPSPPMAIGAEVAEVAVPMRACAARDDVAPIAGIDRVAGDAAPARTVQVRVWRRIAGARRHHVGLLQLSGEATGARELQLDSSAAIELKVQPGEPVTFSSPGYVAASWLPPAMADADTTHEVTLEPASALRFHWSPAPGSVPERVVVDLRMQHDALTVPGEGKAALDRTIEVAVLGGGDDIAWALTTTHGATLVRATGIVVGLGLAEVRDVSVDLAAVPMQQHVLVGPSSELMPQLTVGWNPGSGRVDTMPVAANGGFQRPASETAEVFVATMVAGVATRRHVDEAAVVQCVLQAAVVGVQLLGDDGAVRTTKVLDARGMTIGRQASTHVWQRGELPAEVILQDGNERLVFATSALVAGADLLRLRRSDARPTGDLVVTVEGTPPTDEARKSLSLVARGDAPGGELAQLPTATTRFVLHESGSYSVRWRCGALEGPEVGRVTVQPGQPAALTTSWPVLQEWTGEVVGFAELPANQRWHRVGFGAGETVFAGWTQRLDRQGRFRGMRFAGDLPPEPVFVAWGLCRVDATIAARDDARRHLVVRPATTLRWVEVVVDAPAPWRVHVMRPVAGGWPQIVHVISHDQRWPMPVAGDQPLLLSLTRSESSTQGVLAWATSSGVDSVLRLQPAPMRRIEVRTRGDTARTISLVGPAGQVDGQLEVRPGEPLCIEVPFDTRAVAPWSKAESSPRQEVGIGGDGIAVID